MCKAMGIALTGHNQGHCSERILDPYYRKISCKKEFDYELSNLGK